MKTIKSPEGVALLLENMWLRHVAGMKQRTDNVFMVELPKPTDEELAKARGRVFESNRSNDESEDIYGAFV